MVVFLCLTLSTGISISELPPDDPYTGNKPAIDHVVLIVWDGVRPDILQQAETPNIDKLVQNGSYSWNVWTVWRPVTRAALPSLHTGAPPAIHGVNRWTGSIHAETISRVLHEAGLTSALVGSDQILGEGYATHATGYYWHSEPGPHFVNRAISWISQHQPSFMYVYNPEPDSAGHRHGHMSEEYFESIQEADVHLGRLLEYLQNEGLIERTLIVVTTDHGMTGHSHSYGFETDMRIFSLWKGPGIKAGYEMEDVTVIPKRKAGRVTVNIHRVESASWSESTVNWNNQPELGNLVTESSVDSTGWFEWDLTDFATLAAEQGAQSGNAHMSFAMISAHSGETPPSDDEEGAVNPALFSEINRAVFFNTTKWEDSEAHPELRVEYITADGEYSKFIITPTDNTMVLSGSPDTNYGSRGNFHIGYFGSGEARAFITFEFDHLLPGGAAIESAIFRASCWRQFPAGYPETHVAHRLIDIAPTITRLMGLRSPRDSTGVVIEQIMDSAVVHDE